MDSSTNFEAPPQAAYFLWYCDKVYHKQEVCFLLYFLGQIVSWHYYPILLDSNWPCTVIKDHDWQLWNCPFTFQFDQILVCDTLYFSGRLYSPGLQTDRKVSKRSVSSGHQRTQRLLLRFPVYSIYRFWLWYHRLRWFDIWYTT